MLNLENVDSPDAWACPLVLTSPRSLAACRLVGVKPVDLLPPDIVELAERAGTHDLAELADLRDALELRRLTKLEHCRAIRRYLISQHAVDEHHLLTTQEYNHSPLYHKNDCRDPVEEATAPPVPRSPVSFQDGDRPSRFGAPRHCPPPTPPTPPTRRAAPFRRRDADAKPEYSKKDPLLDVVSNRKDRLYDRSADRALIADRTSQFHDGLSAVAAFKKPDKYGCLFAGNYPDVPPRRPCSARPVLVDCFGRASLGPPSSTGTFKGDPCLPKRVPTRTRKPRSAKSKRSESSCPSEKLTSSTDQESRIARQSPSRSRSRNAVGSPASSMGKLLESATKGRKQSWPDHTETSTVASVTSEREIPEEGEIASDITDPRGRPSPRTSNKGPSVGQKDCQRSSKRDLDLGDISTRNNAADANELIEAETVGESHGHSSDITSKTDAPDTSSRAARTQSATPSDLDVPPKVCQAYGAASPSPTINRLTPLVRRVNSRSSVEGTDLSEAKNALNVRKRGPRRRTRSLSTSRHFQPSPISSTAEPKKCSSEICFRPRSGRCLSEEIRRFVPHSSYFSYKNKMAVLGSQWRRTADAAGLSEEDRKILRLLERKALEKKSSEMVAENARVAWEREKAQRSELQKWEEERRKIEISQRREQDHAETMRRLAYLEKNFNRAQRRLAETLRRRDEEAQIRLANIALQRDAMRAQKKSADFARKASAERQLRLINQETRKQRHQLAKEIEGDWSVDSALGSRPVCRGASSSLLLLPSTPEPCSLRKRPASAPRLTSATSDPRIASARMLREAMDRNQAVSRERFAVKSEAAVRAAASRVSARVQARSQRVRITSTKRRVAHLATAAHLRVVRGAAVARLKSRIRAGERKMTAILAAKERSVASSRATAAVASQLRQRLRGTLSPATFDQMAAEAQRSLRIPSSRAWTAPADHQSVTHIRLG